MNCTKVLAKLATRGVFIALLAVLVAACGNEITPAPQATSAATPIPAPDPFPNSTAMPVPTEAAIPAPDPTLLPTPAPTTIPTPEPTPLPTIDPEDATKAEVVAIVRRFGQALSTADPELMASLFLQTEKTNRFSTFEPIRKSGWLAVEESFKGLLSLPPGSGSLVTRLGRVDVLGDDAALWTGHFLLNIRPPEQPRQTVERSMTVVLEKVGGKWLRAHMHTSVLPQ